jgi:hypothetical protein
MWRSHPSCIRSWSVLLTFKSSESSKEVRPGSIEVLAKHLFVAIANVESGTLSFSRSFPHHGQFFRPLNLIIVSVPIVRRRDVIPPSATSTVLTTPLRPHGLTIVKLRVAHTRYRAGSVDRYNRSGHKKGSLLPRTASARYHHRSCSSSS